MIVVLFHLALGCRHIITVLMSHCLCLVTAQSVVQKLKGQQVQWLPGIIQLPTYILWIHNGSIVLKFDNIVEKVYDSYEGRVTLDRQTAQLQISDLRSEDSGKYECEIHLQDKWFHKSYELEVIGKAAFVIL